MGFLTNAGIIHQARQVKAQKATTKAIKAMTPPPLPQPQQVDYEARIALLEEQVEWLRQELARVRP